MSLHNHDVVSGGDATGYLLQYGAHCSKIGPTLKTRLFGFDIRTGGQALGMGAANTVYLNGVGTVPSDLENSGSPCTPSLS